MDDADVTLISLRVDRPDDELTIQRIEAGEKPAAHAHRFLADADADRDEPTLSTNAFLVSAALQTDRGRAREENEDRYLVMDDRGVYFVADGMGGHAGGAVASQLAVDTLERVFRSGAFDTAVRAELPRRATELAQAMQAANLAVWERAARDPELRGMGTTLIGARFALKKNRVYVGHIGDSRCYRLRDGELTQLTRDHTLAAAGVDGPMSSRLIRAAGVGSEVEIDLVIAEPQVDDLYLFCSDGLNKMVPDGEIRTLLSAHANDLGFACRRLIDAAHQHGGKDNVTVILVAVCPPPRESEPN